MNTNEEPEESELEAGCDYATSRLANELLFSFMMLYTSPSWGGDERTPEGWRQKKAALLRAFILVLKSQHTHPPEPQ